MTYRTFVCTQGHVTPYAGRRVKVIACPEPIGARMRCGALARVVVRVEEVPIGP